LPSTPGENTELSAQQAARLGQLDRELQEWRGQLEGAAPAPIDLDENALEMLRGLGYLQ
jgi:hypothetical protein